MLDQLGAVWKPPMQHHSAVPCMIVYLYECQSDKREKWQFHVWMPVRQARKNATHHLAWLLPNPMQSNASPFYNKTEIKLSLYKLFI
jgi:hypothetical protein